MASKRTKVQELSIFTIGIGVIIALLTLWLSFVLQPTSGQQRSSLMVVVPLVTSVIYILLGVLVAKLKHPGVIILTMLLVAAGFVIDLLIGFHIVKAIFDLLIISLIIKTGLQALVEVEAHGVAQ